MAVASSPRFVLLIVISQCPSVLLASSRPQLSLAPTRDVSLICSADGVRERIHSLKGLQIVQNGVINHGQLQDEVLATATHGGEMRLSEHATRSYPVSKVTGGFLRKQRRRQWLKLTMAGDTPFADSAFSCTIFYLTHPADVRLTLWRSKEILLNPGSKNGLKTPGFEMKIETGLSFACELNVDDFESVSSVKIAAASKPGVLLSWEAPNTESVPARVSAEKWALNTCPVRAHLFETVCDDDGSYICRVALFTSTRLESEAQNFTTGKCLDSEKLTLSNVKTKDRGDKERSSADEPQYQHLSTVVSVSALSFVAICIMVFICVSRRRRRRHLSDGATDVNLRKSHRKCQLGNQPHDADNKHTHPTTDLIELDSRQKLLTETSPRCSRSVQVEDFPSFQMMDNCSVREVSFEIERALNVKESDSPRSAVEEPVVQPSVPVAVSCQVTDDDQMKSVCV
ncbi:hypothetical protein BaRGS_00033491 [Batillaria attramentaria]|uniref:Ig-like domain-containing protein n=1 Tax=Batillaria attramentaria TaxID=370345 RepID=A0ABD0JKL8_9CAEN